MKKKINIENSEIFEIELEKKNWRRRGKNNKFYINSKFKKLLISFKFDVQKKDTYKSRNNLILENKKK